MSNSIRQTQTQKQGLNTFLLQQKLQVLHLMHLPALALEEYLKNQLEENPVLEEGSEEEREEEIFSNEAGEEQPENKLSELSEYFDEDEIPEYKTYVNNFSKDEPAYTAQAIYYQSFQEQLKDQLKDCKVAPDLKHQVEYLIDSLDEDGYLRTSLEDLANDYSFSCGHLTDEVQMMNALIILQGFDPPGIGARTLQECLMLQLQRDKSHDHPAAEAILKNHFSELYHKNYEKIKREEQLDDESLKQALTIISRLTPKPVFVASKDMTDAQVIVPEFIVAVSGDEIDVMLADNPTSSIRVNESFLELINTDKEKQKRKTELNYFRKKVNEAKWLIEALHEREHTLMEIMKVIASIQKEYFLTGELKNLKPMILEDVAKRTGYDISTVSRVTCNKYAQTPFGNILLKDVFSNTLHTSEGEAISSQKLKQSILEIVEQENKSKPYTDYELMEQLKMKGYEIARRTIVKYRESLHLPNARMRRKMV
jgi:RNA polymerase sigma-54 factor